MNKALQERREAMSGYAKGWFDAAIDQWPKERLMNILAEIKRIRLVTFELVDPPKEERDVLLSEGGAITSKDMGAGESGGELPKDCGTAKVVPVPYRRAYSAIETMFNAVQDMLECEIIQAV